MTDDATLADAPCWNVHRPIVFLLLLLLGFEIPPSLADTYFESTPVWAGPVEATLDVALGDIDGDGDLDLVRGNNGQECTLYLNTGGAFASSPAWKGQSENTWSVALGDVDGDGDLDLVRGNFENDPGASLYLNEGGMLATTPAWTGGPERTTCVVLGDVDNDGDLDLVRGNYDRSTTLYLNSGGTFASRPAWNGPREYTYSVALGDIDRDGDLDLVRGNYESGSTLYLNTGNRFESTPAWTGPAERTRSIALGDVNGDGNLDLVCGNFPDQGATLFFNTGGVFSATPAWTGPAEDTRALTLGDVDGDGDIDLIRGNSDGTTLYLNVGGSFHFSPAWAGPEEVSTSVALGDVDGDADLDLVSGSFAAGTTLHLNKDGQFASTPAEIGRVEDTRDLVLGDVDGDDDLDLVRANFDRGPTLYLNQGGTFGLTPVWTGPGERTTSAALGDVDGDHDLDLVCGYFDEGARLFLNTGGTFASIPAWTGPIEQGWNVALGDIDGDGDLDLVRGNNNAGATLYLNDGGVFGSTPVWTGLPEYTLALALGDVDGDGDIDLVRGNFEPGPTLYLNTGNSFASAPAWTGPTELTLCVALGDVDGDGDLDLVRGNFNMGATLYLNTGATFTSTPAWKGIVEKTRSVALADVDGDGDLDLVAGSAGGVSVYVNTGVTFESTPGWTGPTGNSARVVLDDVNDDGDLDLVRADSNGNATVYSGKSPWSIPRLPDQAAHIRGVRVTSSGPDGQKISFQAIDRESDPLWLIGEYQFNGAPNWHPMQWDNSSLRAGPWSTSPDGVSHEVVWNAASVPSDRRDVIIRLRSQSPPRRTGSIQFVPCYRLNVGLGNVAISSLALADAHGDYPTGFDTRVIVSLPEWSQFRDGTLYYRPGGATAYDSTALGMEEVIPGQFVPTGVIPGGAVGPRGIEYWVKVRTPAQVITDPRVNPGQMPRILETRIDGFRESGSHPGDRYRMVSVPLEADLPPTASLEAFLSDQVEFGPYDPMRWRAFRYLPESGGYREISEAATSDGALRPAPGRAFWLISRMENRIDTTPIPGRSTTTSSPYPVTLQPGWNQIGNPFAFPVFWSEVVWEGLPDAVEPPIAWDENGQRYLGDAATLEPFSGYWIMNRSGQPVTIAIPPYEATPSQKSGPPNTKERADQGWLLRITASSSTMTDAFNYVGVSSAEGQGTIVLDRSDPPLAPGTGLSLYFLPARPDVVGENSGTLRTSPLTADIRKPIPDSGDPKSRGECWSFDFVLNHDMMTPEKVTLRFEGLDLLPSNLEVWVVDRVLDRTVDLRKQQTMSYAAPEADYKVHDDEARFELRIGTMAYVEATDPHVPGEAPATRILPNYPNPFAAGTIIRFQTDRSALVSISVFDVMGRLVRVLSRELRDAGVHEIVWRGDDEQGHSLPEGVYFVHLVTPWRAESRKLVKTWPR